MTSIVSGKIVSVWPDQKLWEIDILGERQLFHRDMFEYVEVEDPNGNRILVPHDSPLWNDIKDLLVGTDIAIREDNGDKDVRIYPNIWICFKRKEA